MAAIKFAFVKLPKRFCLCAGKCASSRARGTSAHVEMRCKIEIQTFVCTVCELIGHLVAVVSLYVSIDTQSLYAQIIIRSQSCHITLVRIDRLYLERALALAHYYLKG